MTGLANLEQDLLSPLLASPQHRSPKSAACCCLGKLLVLTVELDQQIPDALNRYESKSVLQRRRQESDNWRPSRRHGAG